MYSSTTKCGMQKAGQTTKVEAAWAHYGALWRLRGLACPLSPSKENCWSVDALPHACPQPRAALGCPEQQTFDGNVRSGSAQVLGASLGLTEFTSAPYRPNTLRHSHHRDLWWRFLSIFLLSNPPRLTLMQDSPNPEVRDAGSGKMSQPHIIRQYLPPITTLAKASQLGNKTSTPHIHQ
jgi:hypothetical protein